MLDGGSASRGKNIFHNNAAAQCGRCHRLGSSGSKVGPPLSGIGLLRSKNHLLQSLIAPSEEITKGYELVVVTLKNGEVVAGNLEAETDETISILPQFGETQTVSKVDIQERESNSVSIMPPMGPILNNFELRDMIAFLSSLDS